MILKSAIVKKMLNSTVMSDASSAVNLIQLQKKLSVITLQILLHHVFETIMSEQTEQSVDNDILSYTITTVNL